MNIDNSHWALVVVHILDKHIYYFDSYGDSPKSKYLELTKCWILDEANAQMLQNFDIDEWETTSVRVPQQKDSSACGVFLIAFADLISNEIPLHDFSHKYEDQLRRKICLDILNKNP